MLTDFRLFLALPIASALRPLAAAPQLAAAPPSRVAPGISGGACGLGGGPGLEVRRAAAGRQQGRGWTGRGSASRATAWRDRRAQGPLRSRCPPPPAARPRSAAPLPHSNRRRASLPRARRRRGAGVARSETARPPEALCHARQLLPHKRLLGPRLVARVVPLRQASIAAAAAPRVSAARMRAPPRQARSAAPRAETLDRGGCLDDELL
jgi:hypothetical protein